MPGDEDGDDADGQAVDVGVPVAFSVIAHRRPQRDGQGRAQLDGSHDELPRGDALQRLRHQAVVVRANGFVYRGVLIGADDVELFLRGELRAIVLPLASVGSVRPAVEERFAPGGQTLGADGAHAHEHAHDREDDDDPEVAEGAFADVLVRR